MSRTRLFAAPLALALLASLPFGGAQAAGDSAVRRERRVEESRAVAAAAVDAGAAVAAVRAAGYGPVHALAWDHGHWSVRADDAHASAARLLVDATTGAVTRRTR